MTHMINDMKKNSDKPKRKENKRSIYESLPEEQMVVVFTIIYNITCEPEITTNQGICDVPCKARMTIDEIEFQVSDMTTNHGTSNVFFILKMNKGTNYVELTCLK